MNKKEPYKFDPFHFFGTYHQLYTYNEVDGKLDKKIPGRYLTSTIVNQALETINERNDRLNAFEDKLESIEKQSLQLYKNRDGQKQDQPSAPWSPESLSTDLLKEIKKDLKTLKISVAEVAENQKALENRGANSAAHMPKPDNTPKLRGAPPLLPPPRSK